MDATNTPSNSDAAADHAANVDSKIWNTLAATGGLAPRVSPVATPMGRPETISETGTRLAREDAARKAAGQPVHRTGTRPVAQPNADLSKQPQQQDGEQSQENPQNQQQAEGYKLQRPENLDLSKPWSEAQTNEFADTARSMGLNETEAQEALNIYADGFYVREAHTQDSGMRTLRSEFQGETLTDVLGTVVKFTNERPALADFLDRTGLGNDPGIVKMIYVYATTDHRMSKQAAQVELDKVIADGSPYWLAGHPKQKLLVARASALFRIIGREE